MSEIQKMLLGIAGTNGAGKSVLCAYLKTLGFQVFSLSDIVRQHAQRKGRSLDRAQLTITGTELKKKWGTDYLAKECYALASESDCSKVVFDSIRHVDEAKFLKKKGTRLIGIDAPCELRFQRIQQRKAATDHTDFLTFQKQSTAEFNGTSSGQHIAAVFQLCEFILQNTGHLDRLKQEFTARLGLGGETNNS